LPGTNTLAYYGNPLITAVIGFIKQALVSAAASSGNHLPGQGSAAGLPEQYLIGSKGCQGWASWLVEPQFAWYEVPLVRLPCDLATDLGLVS
jgi:hypothetical protein